MPGPIRTAEMCSDAFLLHCDVCRVPLAAGVCVRAVTGSVSTGAFVCVPCVAAMARAAFADVVPTLIAVRDDFLPTDDEQIGYGAFHGGDPRQFTPDPECSTEEERAAHKAACDAWDRGDEVEIRGGCEYREVEPGSELSAAVEEVRKGAAVATTGPAVVRVQRQTFGLGTYVCRDPQVTEIVERINAAIAAMGGE